MSTRIVIGCGAEVIARHQRSYEKADMVFEPMHFLPLLEQKVGALDQVAPLKGWDPARGVCHPAPACWKRAWARRASANTSRVLRLLESFEMAHVHGAIKQSLELGAIGYDAVKHLVLCRIEQLSTPARYWRFTRTFQGRRSRPQILSIT